MLVAFPSRQLQRLEQKQDVQKSYDYSKLYIVTSKNHVISTEVDVVIPSLNSLQNVSGFLFPSDCVGLALTHACKGSQHSLA